MCVAFRDTTKNETLLKLAKQGYLPAIGKLFNLIKEGYGFARRVCEKGQLLWKKKSLKKLLSFI